MLALILFLIYFVLVIVYKVSPRRDLPPTQPGFAWFPKYKKTISSVKNWDETVKVLELHGFRREAIYGDTSVFERKRFYVAGHRTFLNKLVLIFQELEEGRAEITLKAAGVILFDRGSLWEVCTEIAEELRQG